MIKISKEINWSENIQHMNYDAWCKASDNQLLTILKSMKV